MMGAVIWASLQMECTEQRHRRLARVPFVIRKFHYWTAPLSRDFVLNIGGLSDLYYQQIDKLTSQGVHFP